MWTSYGNIVGRWTCIKAGRAFQRIGLSMCFETAWMMEFSASSWLEECCFEGRGYGCTQDCRLACLVWQIWHEEMIRNKMRYLSSRVAYIRHVHKHVKVLISMCSAIHMKISLWNILRLLWEFFSCRNLNVLVYFSNKPLRLIGAELTNFKLMRFEDKDLLYATSDNHFTEKLKLIGCG